jgi:putative addiction module component (TIGR02574 family)
MARTLTTEEILEMPVPERLQPIESLWDSINTNDLPIPEGHQHALDEALADYRRNPDEGQSWSEVRDELFPKR